jgi:hypothetical protein
MTIPQLTEGVNKLGAGERREFFLAQQALASQLNRTSKMLPSQAQRKAVYAGSRAWLGGADD